MKLPDRLLSYAEVRAAAETVERAVAVATKAERAMAVLKARGVPPCAAPFDEAKAAKRLAQARAHDQVHPGAKSEAEVTAQLEVERAACAQACEASDVAAREAQAALAAAEDAHEGAQSILAAARNDLYVKAQRRAETLLPGMVAAALGAAEELFFLANEIRAVAAIESPGTSLSQAYVEVGLPGGPLHEDVVQRLGGRVGSTRSTRAVVFEGR